MRIYRTPDLDLEATPEPESRIEVLRELVDLLPEPQKTVVSLRFFGAAKTFKTVAEMTGLNIYQVKEILDDGLVQLRDMLEGHEVGKVLAEQFSFVDRHVQRPH